MSTDYDIACTDCCCRMGIMDANHQGDLMREIIEHREVFEAFAQAHARLPVNLLWRVELTVHCSSAGGFDAQWLLRHKGHALEVVDEYDRREWQPDPTRLTFEKLAEEAR